MRPCFRFRRCVKGLALTLSSWGLARGYGAVYEGEREDEGGGEGSIGEKLGVMNVGAHVVERR